MQAFYGYLRGTPSDPQGEEQKRALLSWGILQAQIFADPFEGAEEAFPALRNLSKTVEEGDVVVLPSLDRLGRSYEEVEAVWRYLVLEKRADIVVLDIPILDTRTNRAQLGTLMSDLLLQLLAYLAKKENDFLRQRQAEGIAQARERGQTLGRPPRPRPEHFDAYYAKWRAKEVSFSEFAQKVGVTEMQLKWLVRKERKETAAR